jgi:hypothetical protein
MELLELTNSNSMADESDDSPALPLPGSAIVLDDDQPNLPRRKRSKSRNR